jgi:hypothetical protein
MLFQAGFLDGHPRRNTNSAGGADSSLITDLSWEGHEFLGVMKDQTAWGKIKSAFSPDELGTLPFAILKDVGVALVKQQAMQVVGLSPP